MQRHARTRTYLLYIATNDRRIVSIGCIGPDSSTTMRVLHHTLWWDSSSCATSIAIQLGACASGPSCTQPMSSTANTSNSRT